MNNTNDQGRSKTSSSFDNVICGDMLLKFID